MGDHARHDSSESLGNIGICHVGSNHTPCTRFRHYFCLNGVDEGQLAFSSLQSNQFSSLNINVQKVGMSTGKMGCHDVVHCGCDGRYFATNFDIRIRIQMFLKRKYAAGLPVVSLVKNDGLARHIGHMARTQCLQYAS